MIPTQLLGAAMLGATAPSGELVICALALPVP